MTETLTETTVGELDGVRVGLANVWERDYVDAAGAARTGVTARVAWTDAGGTERWEVVGVGSRVAFSASAWQVTRIEKVAGTPGEVVWERVTAG